MKTRLISFVARESIRRGSRKCLRIQATVKSTFALFTDGCNVCLYVFISCYSFPASQHLPPLELAVDGLRSTFLPFINYRASCG